MLEDRAVPAGIAPTASGVVSGTAFVDANGNGTLTVQETSKVLTPDQCFDWLKTQPANAGINFHALLGGLDPDLSWASLRLFEQAVLPRLVDAGMVELNT